MVATSGKQTVTTNLISKRSNVWSDTLTNQLDCLARQPTPSEPTTWYWQVELQPPDRLPRCPEYQLRDMRFRQIRVC